MLKHQNRQRQRNTTLGTSLSPPPQAQGSSTAKGGEEPTFNFSLPIEYSPEPNISLRHQQQPQMAYQQQPQLLQGLPPLGHSHQQSINSSSFMKRGGSPITFPLAGGASSHQKNSEKQSLYLKNESSIASTTIISKSINDNSPSPIQKYQQLTLQQVQDLENKQSSHTNGGLPIGAMILSDSDSQYSGIMTGVGVVGGNPTQGYAIGIAGSNEPSKRSATSGSSRIHSKNSSQVSRQSKSRNQQASITSATYQPHPTASIAATENALIQEGINALFSKSKKKKKEKDSQSPFTMKTQSNIVAVDHPSLAYQQQQQHQSNHVVPEPRTQRTSSKSKRAVGAGQQKKSKSAKRSAPLRANTINESRVRQPQQPSNSVLPNAKKLNRLLQIQSFEQEPNEHISITSSLNQEGDSLTLKPTATSLSGQGGGAKKILTQSENIQKVIKQGRAAQILVSYWKHQFKDEKRKYFERWRFMSVADRSNVQILAQTRWINDLQSVRTESDLEQVLKSREQVLRKGIACLFRYRSRRVASMFSNWKYKVHFMGYMQNYLAFRQRDQRLSGGQGYRQSSDEQQQQDSINLFAQVQSLYSQTQNRISILEDEDLGSPKKKQRNHRMIQSHVEKNADSDELDENIQESEDSAEKAISRQKKMGLLTNKTVGRQSNKEYNFKNPTAELEQLPYQIELFRQILQSPNKDFGRLMKHQSDCSIQYFNDNAIMAGDELSSRRISLIQNTLTQQQQAASTIQRMHSSQMQTQSVPQQQYKVQQHQQNEDEETLMLMGGEQTSHKSLSHLQLLFSVLLVKKRLENQLREVFREWRRETDRYLQGLEFKIKQRELSYKKQVVSKLASVRVINNSALLRHLQTSFNQWKMLTFIDKKAENRKLQMYFINNAKVEVERSKQVLQKLYKQKQMFDEESKLIERSRSASPEPISSTISASGYATFASPNQQQRLPQNPLNQSLMSLQSFGPSSGQKNASPHTQYLQPQQVLRQQQQQQRPQSSEYLQQRRQIQSARQPMQQQPVVANFSSQNLIHLMNPYFQRNQHALPQRLQSIVNQKTSELELVNQIKTLCYDMLLDILEEAEKNQKSPNSN